MNGCIELARTAKEVGSSQECQVFLYSSDGEKAELLKKMRGDTDFLVAEKTTNEVDDLRFVLIVSKVTVLDSHDELVSLCPSYNVDPQGSESGFSVGVKLSEGKKCERCWYYSDTVKQNEIHEQHEHSDICPRCTSVVKTQSHA